MIDSHCHLDHEPLFKNLNQVLERSKKIGLKKILTISTSLKSYKNILKIVDIDELRDDQKLQLSLPLRHGGCGLRTHAISELRRLFVSSAMLVAPAVHAATGFSVALARRTTTQASAPVNIVCEVLSKISPPMAYPRHILMLSAHVRLKSGLAAPLRSSTKT